MAFSTRRKRQHEIFVKNQQMVGSQGGKNSLEFVWIHRRATQKKINWFMQGCPKKLHQFLKLRFQHCCEAVKIIPFFAFDTAITKFEKECIRARQWFAARNPAAIRFEMRFNGSSNLEQAWRYRQSDAPRPWSVSFCCFSVFTQAEGTFSIPSRARCIFKHATKRIGWITALLGKIPEADTFARSNMSIAWSASTTTTFASWTIWAPGSKAINSQNSNK